MVAVATLRYPCRIVLALPGTVVVVLLHVRLGVRLAIPLPGALEDA